jgi:predicted nuclease with RNAse H fold
MRTLGIDLAAQPENTAACVIDWPDAAGGRVDVTRPQSGYDDHDLLGLMRNAGVVAIDAPFGWPEFMNAHLGEYAARGVWPLRPDDEGAEDWIMRLRYRETDRAVRRLLLARKPPVKLWPLSVSSNLIAVCAWRCAALLHQDAQRPGNLFDRTGERSRIFEVYPAAALANWGLPFKGYKPGSLSSEKTKHARAKREKIADALAVKAAWLRRTDYSDLRDDLVDDDDLLDAFISSLAARAAATGWTVAPHSGQEQWLAGSEGWIHVPEEHSLGELV